MFRSTLALALSSILLCSCGSTPTMQLDLRSDPAGAQVYFSRRGEKAVQAKVGPMKGNVKAETLQEDFMLLGTSPLLYSTPLTETESDATVMGFGGRVLLKYKEGVLRFEKPGYETVERFVRIKDGEMEIHVQMPPSAVTN